MIPRKPTTDNEKREAMQEQFVKGADRKKKAAAGDIRWYNLPIPAKIHAAAKYNAMIEGVSLAKYYIDAIAAANERREFK